MSYQRLSGSKTTILDILMYPADDLTFNQTNPGTAYVTGSLTGCGRCTIDFSKMRVIQGRIVVSSAEGNEAGNGKGVCIYNITDGAVLCEVVWNGVNAAQRVGAWTTISLNREISVGVYVKASSATEALKVETTHFQVLVEN